MKRVNSSTTEKYKALQKTEEGKSTKKSVTEEYGLRVIPFPHGLQTKKIFEVYEAGQVNSIWKKLKKSGNED